VKEIPKEIPKGRSMVGFSAEDARAERIWRSIFTTDVKLPMRDQLPAHYKRTAASNEEIREWNEWRADQ
jgi:hypothetical protein